MPCPDQARMTPENVERFVLMTRMLVRHNLPSRVLEAVVEDDPLPLFDDNTTRLAGARDYWLQIAAFALGQAVREQTVFDNALGLLADKVRDPIPSWQPLVNEEWDFGGEA